MTIEKEVATAVIVPLAVLFVTPLCRRIIRGKERTWDIYCIGLDALMAALASGLINAVEVLYEALHGGDLSKLFWPMVYAGVYCIVVFILLLFTINLHQSFETAKAPKGDPFFTRRNAKMLGVSNLVGLVTLGSIIYFIKKP